MPVLNEQAQTLSHSDTQTFRPYLTHALAFFFRDDDPQARPETQVLILPVPLA